jgi:ribosomal protein S6--L-glutamate ligase
MTCRVIRDNKTLFSSYDDLTSQDIIIGRIRLRHSEENLLLDLLARNILLIPSASSQLCSRSKVFQTRLLQSFMIPGTKAIYDLHDLMDAVSEYTQESRTAVICKLDRANGGQGILKYSSVEDVFNQAALGNLTFPFVLQPFLNECIDVRVVILGKTIEAYKRFNPNNFRHNLHCGGASSVFEPSNEQLNICKKIMLRADFPYAHIDLLLTPGGDTWLTEINLRGGLRGAILSQKDYLALTSEIHDHLLQKKISKT